MNKKNGSSARRTMLIYIAIVFTLSSELLVDVMSSSDFFPEVKGNLTEITWAHAVNNQAYLAQTLQNASIMMIEADVVYGKLINGTEDMPIMGHPPSFFSDLSLQEFLNKTYLHNQQPGNSTKKGVKLDFKTIDVFNKSIDIIEKLYSKIDYPFWLNADIVTGPVNASAPVDPKQFIDGAVKFPKSILSLGWTTNYGKGPNITKASYSDEHIGQMLAIIGSVKQEITFPMRAGIVARSLTQVKTLKQRVPNSTLTIWSSDGDAVDVTLLRKVIFEYGVEKVYVDVPQELHDQLNLGNSGFRLVATKYCMILYAVLILFLTYL